MDSLVRFSEINQSKSFEFHLTLQGEKVCELIERLDVLNIKKISLVGNLTLLSKNKWDLKAELRATVRQKCVITLKSVQTVINEKINRTFSPSALQNTSKLDDDGTSPVVFDDSLQDLNDEIDLAEIIFEELTLILPLYPKFEGAELGSYTVTEPGAKPLNDENLKPFAQLLEMKNKLLKKN